MKLYRTRQSPLLAVQNRFFSVDDVSWDELFAMDDPGLHLRNYVSRKPLDENFELRTIELLAPIVSQEVWAAGVTYYRSRDARMAESSEAGGSDFYDRVYDAPRPELFFKASAHRVVGPGSSVRVRSDSKWNVPEPELTLAITRAGHIFGYTIGNDMSSRDIEGENPLYLPQAKVYDRSCALGPCILITQQPLPKTTEIRLEIRRQGEKAFAGSTTLAQLKREPQELVDYLMRDNSFPHGCFLMTGTGIVPDDRFSLEPSDEIRIEIDPIGRLTNRVK